MSLDLELSEGEVLLRNTAEDFLRRDAPKDVVQHLLDTDTGVTDELWRTAAEMGWLGIVVPQEYGGSGLPLTSAGVLFETLGAGPLPGPYFSSAVLGTRILLRAGSEEQKQTLLPALANGDEIVALAMTEPSCGWDAGSIEVTASRESGELVLNGTKLFVMDAQAATKLIVVARTDDSDDPADGISLLLVDRDTEGVSVHRQPGFLAGQTSRSGSTAWRSPARRYWVSRTQAGRHSRPRSPRPPQSSAPIRLADARPSSRWPSTTAESASSSGRRSAGSSGSRT